MKLFTKFTEAPNAGPVVKGLLKLLIAALLLLNYVFEPGLLGQLSQLIAGALAVDALLSPLLNKQTSFAAAALKLLVSCAKYLLALVFVLVSTKNLITANTADMSIVIALPLLVLSLWKLTELWREWQRQWIQQENQLPAPWQSKSQEMPREVSAPPTIPEQVQTPQTIPAPTLPERRADGYYSVARRQGSLIHFLLWLLFLLLFVFSVLVLLMLPFAAALTAFVPPSGFWSALWDDSKWRSGLVFFIYIQLTILLIVISGSRQCVWRKWRYGYDVDSDKFFRDSGSVWGSFQRDESWPADDFVAIYWKKCGWAKAQLWLKSCDDYEDVPLTDRKSGNEWFVRRLAKELSAASGLPVQPQP